MVRSIFNQIDLFGGCDVLLVSSNLSCASMQSFLCIFNFIDSVQIHPCVLFMHVFSFIYSIKFQNSSTSSMLLMYPCGESSSIWSNLSLLSISSMLKVSFIHESNEIHQCHPCDPISQRLILQVNGIQAIFLGGQPIASNASQLRHP